MATEGGGRVSANTGDGGLGTMLQLLQLTGRGTGGTTVSTQTQNNPGNTETQTQSSSGGTDVTTMNPGDDSFLRALFGEMQGADYEGLLASIFQQAQGAIPGFQAAFGNAVGARSGNNSAVASMLQRLLQQTTTSAQAQMMDAQLRNQATRSNIGSAIAQNTRGTRVETRRAPQHVTTTRNTPPQVITNRTETVAPKQPNQLGDLLLLGMLGQGAKWAKGAFGEKTDPATDAAAAGLTTTDTSATAGISGDAGINGLDLTTAQAQPVYSNFNDTAPSYWGGAAQPISYQQPAFSDGWGYDMGGGGGNAMDWATVGANQGGGGDYGGFDFDSWLDDQGSLLDSAGWGGVDGGSGFGGYQEMPVFDAGALDEWDSTGSWW